MKVYVYYFVWVSSIIAIISYPNRPPSSACDSMKPIHPSINIAQPQTTNPPFTLSHTINTNGVDSVNIASTSSTYRISGLMVQARNCSNDTQKLGSFAVNNQYLIQTIKCDHAHDTVGHASGLNVTSVSFNWNRPSGLNQNEYYFNATVLHNYTIFWTNIPFGGCSGN